MRIAILGPAPWVPTGYGVQVRALLSTLRALGHQVAVFAFVGLEGGPIVWDGVPIYPKLFHPMGQDMAMHARHFAADIVISVMDIWHLEPGAWEGVPLAPYFPVDHAPVASHIGTLAARCAQPIVYSQFGQTALAQAGCWAAYVPCGVDCEVFVPQPRADARETLGWPQDRYIVGMVQANVGRPSRKAFEPQLRAFAWFQEQHPDAMLYLHTFLNAGRETDGEHLVGMLQSVGLQVGRDVLVPDQYGYAVGLPAAHLARCYSGMNVLLQATSGEGFGVPLVEAQACGTPVICGDWTSMPELCGAGWTVPRLTATVYGREVADDDLWGTLGGYKVIPRASAIVGALEAAYQNGDGLRQLARAFAQSFDVRAVAERYWRPLLTSLEARV